MFVFPILVAATGGWAVEICMAYPAKIVLAAFQTHSAMNDAIKRALQKAGLPSVR